MLTFSTFVETVQNSIVVNVAGGIVASDMNLSNSMQVRNPVSVVQQKRSNIPIFFLKKEEGKPKDFLRIWNKYLTCSTFMWSYFREYDA